MQDILPRCCMAAFTLFACLAPGAYSQQSGTARALTYDLQTRGPVAYEWALRASMPSQFHRTLEIAFVLNVGDPNMIVQKIGRIGKASGRRLPVIWN